MSRKVSFGIVGCGVIAGLHADAVRSNPESTELVACFDAVPERAQEFAKKYDGIAAYSDLDAFLAHPGLQAVCVCTPSGLHAEAVLAAASKGIHALVEKPLDITKQGLDAIVKAGVDNNVKIAGVFQRRTWETLTGVRKAILDGAIGNPVLGEVQMHFVRTQAYYDSGTWRGTWALDGGGALMNQGIHGVDALIYMMGPVESVKATMATRTHSIEVEDTVAAILRFRNGALGTIVATTSSDKDHPIHFELHGEKGSIALDEHQILRWNVENVPQPEIDANAPDFWKRGHVMLVADLADAILQDRAPFVTADEGRAAVDVILAIYESARTGCEVEIA